MFYKVLRCRPVYMDSRFSWPPVTLVKAIGSVHLVPGSSSSYTVFEKQNNAEEELMKSIDLMYQTMLAELGQRSLDAAWTADFSAIQDCWASASPWLLS
jgi:hypothetical protein